MLFKFYPLIVCALAAVAFRIHAIPTAKDNTSPVEVTFAGKTYINKGLVAFGLIPSDFIEETGDTLGGIGSAVAIQPSSWKDLGNGTYTGTFIVHPDRGYNVETTIDYQARQHTIDFALTPYYDPSPLSFSSAQNTLLLSYRSTVLQYERNGFATTGLDSTAFRTAGNSDPVLPVPASTNRLSLDVEGIVANADGTFWISDEYGPYIYKYSSDGQLQNVIQPPAAILPLDDSGEFFFTSDDDPATGRSANQGFEGLTIDAENQILYAMLQSATIQDGGSDKTTSRYTRLLAYDVSSSPTLVGEYVVPLPQSNKGKTRGSSEILFIHDGVFLSLSRDGDGRGGDELKSKYKQADLFDISGATDIHGTKYDHPSNPIAVDGELVDDLTPATYASFVDFIDDDQLARFGLHNGGDDDNTLIAAKWESLALVPIGDGNDYFLFTVADNDFISTRGISLGEPFDAGKDVDSQFLVFRVTL